MESKQSSETAIVSEVRNQVPFVLPKHSRFGTYPGIQFRNITVSEVRNVPFSKKKVFSTTFSMNLRALSATRSASTVGCMYFFSHCLYVSPLPSISFNTAAYN